MGQDALFYPKQSLHVDRFRAMLFSAITISSVLKHAKETNMKMILKISFHFMLKVFTCPPGHFLHSYVLCK